MNKQTEKPGAGAKAPRARFVVAILVVAGAVVIAALVISKRKPESPVPEATTEQGQPAETAIPREAAGKKSSSATNEVVQPGVDTLPFQAERKLMADASVPLSERRKAAEALAQQGTDAALAALKQAFASGPGDLKVAIAESLGKCGSPECAKWLQELLQDSSTLVARGAARGLAAQGTPEAAAALVRMLGDANADADLRMEVASSLGSVEQPGVAQALADVARSAEDPDLATAALGALGARDFAETEAFFKQYLNSPDISPDLRVTAVEALAQAQGDPTSFLLSMASDKDADVRAAAAWAMSATEATGNAGAQLLDLISKETDPDVRLRLYQALRNQDGFDTGAALGLVQKETSPSARIAGLDLLAKAVRDTPTPQLQSFFDTTAIAELKQIALTGQSYDDRQAAIIALTRARTPGAMSALRDLSGQLNAQNAPQPGGAVRPK